MAETSKISPESKLLVQMICYMWSSLHWFWWKHGNDKQLSRKLQICLHPNSSRITRWVILAHENLLFYLIWKMSYQCRTQFNTRPYRKNVLNIYLSETTELFERKLGLNIHWMALIPLQRFFKLIMPKHHIKYKCMVYFHQKMSELVAYAI